MTASNALSSRTAPAAVRPRNAASSSSTAERFTLRGPSRPLDPSVNAYRRDLADIALAGELFAPHYARPVTRLGGAGATALWSAPARASELVATLQQGEGFAVIEFGADWAWGYRLADHRVGYVPIADLVTAVAA